MMQEGSGNETKRSDDHLFCARRIYFADDHERAYAPKPTREKDRQHALREIS
jgi:hypothetical protein